MSAPRLVVFVVDTSASMGQRAGPSGMTYLDCAKACVEHFLKKSRMYDRYFLVTCAPGLEGIVCGWKDPPAKLVEDIKSLKAQHESHLGVAIRKAFELLNLHRLQSGIDAYGQGRKPSFLSSASVIVLTDGGVADLDISQTSFSSLLSVGQPLQQVTPEWYRWDQRLFAIVNAFPRLLGTPVEAVVENPTTTELQRLCDMTGGSVYFPTSMKALLQSVESIIERSSFPGVTIDFECLPQIPKGLHSVNAQFVRLPPIQQQPVQMWWPLPEDYHVSVDIAARVDIAISSSSGASVGNYTRSAHPSLLFTASDKKLSVLPSFPLDKYELEASSFTAFFLRTVKEGMCWPLHCRFNHPPKVFKNGGYLTPTTNEGKLVGFLKQSSNRPGIVNLYVLPYNFPELFTLLDELINRCKGVASQAWRVNFDVYIRNLPYYYVAPLRSALKHMGLQNVLSDQIETAPPVQLISFLKKATTNAKLEADRFDAMLESERAAAALLASNAALQQGDFLPRPRLLSELQRLRTSTSVSNNSNNNSNNSVNNANVKSRRSSRVSEDYRRFSLPIAVMGDYHDKQNTGLRDARLTPEEEIRVKPLFGNPFFPMEKVANRLKKDSIVMDESEDIPLEQKQKSPNKKRLSSPTRRESPEHGASKKAVTKIPSPPLDNSSPTSSTPSSPKE